jgi:hypothetical protein
VRRRRALIGALLLVGLVAFLVLLRSEAVSSLVLLVVVCSIVPAWVGATVAVLALRSDWVQLKSFLFTVHPGIRGGPIAFWAMLALVVLVRMFA